MTDPHTTREIRTPPTWRVLSWNVRGNHTPDVHALAEVIAGYAPDVAALQEIRRSQANQLAGTLGWGMRWARKHHPYSPLAWWLSEGHALLTPHALRDTVARTISPGVSTWTHQHRIVLSGTVERGDDRLRIHDTHLAAGNRVDDRIAQARRVAACAIADAAEPGAPTVAVVAGDLNAAGEPEVTRELHPAGLRDPGGGPTHPATVPRRRFDYVLVPERSRVTEQHSPNGGEEWWELSDHLPVFVSFSTAMHG